ncbi:3-keto-disaccharide hydrolase [Zunongwangia endophytica]|uniref:DUF1080 domain-containing protein n=1 Tax=Zunongwangia endophytica TaxID=1808945 RepID=A0ABV8HBX6_9FLAO|nr:DUF1080 domain-containing protein [Zunongwangia endophytica]MDN3593808.1 DUF1080 domain-containing protein [Zunongwangia endophytica]
MKKLGIALIASAFTIVSCKNSESDKSEKVANEESTAEIEKPAEDWIDLSTSNINDHWKAYNRDSITQWTSNDATFHLLPKEGRNQTENLITKEKYTDFELSMEWKISEAGNSGFMWAVIEDKELDEPYLTGPEIQVLDNEKHPDGKNGPKRHAGALYDMIAPSENTTKPVGEWNSIILKIDHKSNKGSVMQNGVKIVEFQVDGDGWEELVANSKFADWEQFGKAKSGHIALQDHGNEVWFRNIKIKRLD